MDSEPQPAPDSERPGRVGFTGRVAALVALPVAAVATIGMFVLIAPSSTGTTPNNGAASTWRGTPSTGSPGSSAPPGTNLPTTVDGVCSGLVAQLPQQVHDRTRRPSQGDPARTAAWGDPPITLGCGVAGPSAPADAQVWLLNGVCWFSPDGALWATVDRAVPVTVTLTGVSTAPGQWVIELSAPITATVPPATNAPTGCRQ